MPPTAVMSSVSNPTGASLKVNAHRRRDVAVAQAAVGDLDRHRRGRVVEGDRRAGDRGRVAKAVEEIEDRLDLAGDERRQVGDAIGPVDRQAMAGRVREGHRRAHHVRVDPRNDESDLRAFRRVDGGVGDRQRHVVVGVGRPVDRHRIGAELAGIACPIAVAARRHRYRARSDHIGRRGERGGVDQRIGRRRQAADRANRRDDVGQREAVRRLAEGEAHRGARSAVAQQAGVDIHRHGGIAPVDRHRVGARRAGIARRVGIAARRHRHRARPGKAVRRREGRRVDQRIGRHGQAAHRAADRRDVVGVEADRRLVEGERHRRGRIAIAQAAVGDVDRHRRSSTGRSRRVSDPSPCRHCRRSRYSCPPPPTPSRCRRSRRSP